VVKHNRRCTRTKFEVGVLVSPAPEVPVIDGDIVSAIRDLASRGVGSKTIAKQLGVARNTVRRYRREPVTAGVQVRPPARKLSDGDRQTARELYAGAAGGQCSRRLAALDRAWRGGERAHDSARGRGSATCAAGRNAGDRPR
jgi:hypothetical protein